jgi:hypothetical protein
MRCPELLAIARLRFVIALAAPLLAGCALQAKDNDDYGYGGITLLDQGWEAETARWWYFLSQGTVFMPYEWFLALEQADGRELFTAPGHMARLGFLIGPADPKYNPHGLPVGFAKRELRLPGQPYAVWQGDWIGFACAACHTGQVSYRGREIRIEGGAAHHDIERFQVALGAALAATLSSEVKTARFVERVLRAGAAVTPEDLVDRFRTYVAAITRSRAFLERAQAAASEVPTASGFGRLDAHERGVNLFLAAPLQEVRNYEPETAPVSFPAIWDTPYFDWVLYNGAIRQPLARNVIEALGVQAPIDPTTILADRVVHGVNMTNVAEGQKSVMYLKSPRWPEQILGPIDKTRAAAGQAVYRQHCAGCHQVIDRDSHAVAGGPAGSAPPELVIPMVPLDEIGTDPRQAATFERRTVSLEKIGGPASIPSRDAAQIVTDKIVKQWIAESPANAELASEVNQGRQNVFRAPLAYRARPLNGIWATAPYLHNGSVPNLHQLLLPAARRDKVFYTGNWEFDPVLVGFESSSPFPGAFRFDTRLPGNANGGHEFGASLNQAERMALIEYLKTL